VRYWLCALLGIAIFVACVVAFSSALGNLLETGTCASGNTPYVIARPCPDGTGTDILLLIGSIFGLFLAMGVFGLRGTRPGGGKGPGGSPFVAGWGIFFTATGAVSLVKSLTSDTIPVDGKTGGIIVGATFLLMGLPALVYWVWSVLTDLGGRDEQPAGLGAATDLGSIGSRGYGSGGLRDLRNLSSQFTDMSTGVGVGSAPARDPISELERLQKLRDAGALTPAEFEQQKARVLRDG
jgi:Short C-terminal domain